MVKQYVNDLCKLTLEIEISALSTYTGTCDQYFNLDRGGSMLLGQWFIGYNRLQKYELVVVAPIDGYCGYWVLEF